MSTRHCILYWVRMWPMSLCFRYILPCQFRLARDLSHSGQSICRFGQRRFLYPFSIAKNQMKTFLFCSIFSLETKWNMNERFSHCRMEKLIATAFILFLFFFPSLFAFATKWLWASTFLYTTILWIVGKCWKFYYALQCRKRVSNVTLVYFVVRMSACIRNEGIERNQKKKKNCRN